jgi:UDP-glucose 4-epimerase
VTQKPYSTTQKSYSTQSYESQPAVSIIGSTGFIGKHLLSTMRLADVQPMTFTREKPFHHQGRLHAALCHSDVIFYLASSITPAVAAREPQQGFEDQHSFRILLDGLRGAGHRPLVVLASSGGTVYDPAFEPPYTEDSPTRAVAGYGAAKLFQEQDLIACSSWITPVILRLANVYGPGQRTVSGYGVVGHWMEALVAGETLKIMGDPRSRRDYVHVADVASAMFAVYRNADRLRHSTAPVVLNIGSGVPTSLEELLRLFERAVCCEIEVQRQAARVFDRRDVWLDICRAACIVDWRPRIALPAGLADTWQEYLRTMVTERRAGLLRGPAGLVDAVGDVVMPGLLDVHGLKLRRRWT